MAKIYEVKVSDGTTQFFDNKVEADFYVKDTCLCGFSVTAQEFDMPETARNFVSFMNRRESKIRAMILAARELA